MALSLTSWLRLQQRCQKLAIDQLWLNSEISLNYRPSFALLLEQYSTPQRLLDYLKQIKWQPVMTGHPTEILSDESLAVYFSMMEALADGSMPSALKYRKRLEEMPLVSKSKYSVLQEVERVLGYMRRLYYAWPRVWYRMYEQLQELLPGWTTDQQHQLGRSLSMILAPRSWAGGDADGNPSVVSEVMVQAAKMHRTAARTLHLEYGKTLRPQLQEIIMLFMEHGDHSMVMERLEEFPQDREAMCLAGQLGVFGTSLASIDIRQNASVIKKTFMHVQNHLHLPDPDLPTLAGLLHDQDYISSFRDSCRFIPEISGEVDRLRVASGNHDIFHNFIISSTSGVGDMLMTEIMVRALAPNLAVVPLYEGLEAITNAKAWTLEYCQYSKHNRAMVMLGYSDSQKESGTGVLLRIAAAEADLHTLPQQIDVFHGIGGELQRGGRWMPKLHQTFQGSHLRHVFGLPELIAVALTERLIPQPVVEIERNKDLSAICCSDYQNFCIEHSDDIDHYLAMNSPLLNYVKVHNYSSRPDSRVPDAGGAGSLQQAHHAARGMDGIRAITLLHAIEGCFIPYDLWLSAVSLPPGELHDNPALSDMVSKGRIGLLYSDPILSRCYLGPQSSTGDRDFLQLLSQKLAMAKEVLESYPQLKSELLSVIELKQKSFEELGKMMAQLNQDMLTSTQVDLESARQLTGAIYLGFLEYINVPFPPKLQG